MIFLQAAGAGVGAGWQEREHTNYGWDLLDMDRRFARFEEGLEVISRLLHSDARWIIRETISISKRVSCCRVHHVPAARLS